jgi:hypothetical protein
MLRDALVVAVQRRIQLTHHLALGTGGALFHADDDAVGTLPPPRPP